MNKAERKERSEGKRKGIQPKQISKPKERGNKEIYKKLIREREQEQGRDEIRFIVTFFPIFGKKEWRRKDSKKEEERQRKRRERKESQHNRELEGNKKEWKREIRKKKNKGKKEKKRKR